MRSFHYCIVFFAVIFIFGSCGNNAEKTPDLSSVKVALSTQRFDKDIYAIDTNHIAAGLQKLQQKYPDFLNFFLDTMMGLKVYSNFSDTAKGIREGVHEYLTFPDFVHLQDSIVKYYPDTKDVDAELSKGFQYIKYYLPFIKTPKVYYVNGSLINTPASAVDSNISTVCLDMYLGPQFPFYASVGVPSYMGPHLRKSYIPVAVFRSTYQAVYPFKGEEKTLLDMMIQRGKEQYFLHKIMPTAPDSVLFGFTGIQIKWCEKNEVELYNFFIQQNLLYNKQESAVVPYIVDGPFARGIGTATDPGNPTPGNVGTWMGYRIVSAYMNQNTNITLKELLTSNIEPAKLLEAAHYKPR